MKRKSKPLSRREVLILMGVIGLGVAVWHIIHTISFLSPLDYLGNQFYVFMHEAGHAIATVITGGDVNEMMVYHRIGGYVKAINGSYLFISPAGYLFPVCFGCLILLVSLYYPEHGDILTYLVGILTMFVAGTFTTNDLNLRFWSLGFVLVSIIWFGAIQRWRFTITIICSILISIAILHIYGIDRAKDSDANLTFLVGVCAGGILVLVAATGKIYASLIVLNVFNAALLYNTATRAVYLLHSIGTTNRNDAMFFASAFGLSSTIVIVVWVGVIILIYLGTLLQILSYIQDAGSHSD